MELKTEEMQFVFYQQAKLSVTGWLRHLTNGALFSSSELKPSQYAEVGVVLTCT